jgi:protein-disulfide isomerase
VAGAPVSLAEVDARAAAQLLRVRQEQYEMRSQALEALLDERVLQREADARHMTVDTLLAREVTARVVPATRAEIDTFFVQNRGQFYGKPVEQVSDAIAAALGNQKAYERRVVFLKSLRKQYAVHVSLEPPRFAVTADADDPARGPADAPVTIVEFSDYQCPYCVRAQQTIEDVVAKYKGRVRLVFRDFPLSIHPNAVPAAIAADCARAHGKYWEMARAMFGDQSRLAPPDLAHTAATLGMDSTAFRACMESPESRTEVDHDTADGRALGISGTPTFYVNGIMIVGAREADVFERTIDAELDRLRR